MPRKQDPLTIEYLLLGLIARKPIHPYDLNKLLREDPELKAIWRFEQSRLYAVLDKIERNGLIRSELTEGEAFPFRKMYSITPEGELMYSAWLYEPVRHVNELRSSFLAKLYFLKNMPEREKSLILEEQLEVCNKWLNRIESSSESEYLLMVADFRTRFIRTSIEWLEDLKNQLCNQRS